VALRHSRTVAKALTDYRPPHVRVADTMMRSTQATAEEVAPVSAAKSPVPAKYTAASSRRFKKYSHSGTYVSLVVPLCLLLPRSMTFWFRYCCLHSAKHGLRKLEFGLVVCLLIPLLKAASCLQLTLMLTISHLSLDVDQCVCVDHNFQRKKP
jgi:hypothetical protein